MSSSQPCEVCNEHPANCRCGHPVFAREQKEMIDRLKAEVERLREDLETERIRLAACGVAALSDTPESAQQQRINSSNPYYSGSYSDVCRRTDECISLRAEVERLRALCRARPRQQKPAPATPEPTLPRCWTLGSEWEARHATQRPKWVVQLYPRHRNAALRTSVRTAGRSLARVRGKSPSVSRPGRRNYQRAKRAKRRSAMRRHLKKHSWRFRVFRLSWAEINRRASRWK